MYWHDLKLTLKQSYDLDTDVEVEKLPVKLTQSDCDNTSGGGVCIELSFTARRPGPLHSCNKRLQTFSVKKSRL